jgi:hypothetical protein
MSKVVFVTRNSPNHEPVREVSRIVVANVFPLGEGAYKTEERPGGLGCMYKSARAIKIV